MKKHKFDNIGLDYELVDKINVEKIIEEEKI